MPFFLPIYKLIMNIAKSQFNRLFMFMKKLSFKKLMNSLQAASDTACVNEEGANFLNSI